MNEADRAVGRINAILLDPDKRVSRAHLETARNELVKAATRQQYLERVIKDAVEAIDKADVTGIISPVTESLRAALP